MSPKKKSNVFPPNFDTWGFPQTLSGQHFLSWKGDLPPNFSSDVCPVHSVVHGFWPQFSGHVGGEIWENDDKTL